jgi:hypothetical protein
VPEVERGRGAASTGEGAGRGLACISGGDLFFDSKRGCCRREAPDFQKLYTEGGWKLERTRHFDSPLFPLQELEPKGAAARGVKLHHPCRLVIGKYTGGRDP